jgi:hypothetical protein
MRLGGESVGGKRGARERGNGMKLRGVWVSICLNVGDGPTEKGNFVGFFLGGKFGGVCCVWEEAI